MRRLFVAILAMGIAGAAAAQEPPKPLSLFAMPSSTGGHSLLRLLRRAEVVTYLSLSLYQQKAIKDLAEDPAAGRLKLSFSSNGPATDPEEMKREAEKQIAEQQKGVLDKIKDILKPEQFARIQELAIQWRGPLILSDYKIAEKAKITGPHRQEIGKLAGEYQRAKMAILMELAETQDEGDPASGQFRRAVRIDSSKIEKTGTPAFNKLSALKKEVDEKIMALLSDDEKKSFEKIQGEQFTFRKEPVGDRF
jgi:hypothetical protein